MTLRFGKLVKVEDNVRLPDDKRKRGDRYLTAYFNEAGDEYRKSFYVPVGHGIPNMPDAGTHESLAAVKYQL